LHIISFVCRSAQHSALHCIGPHCNVLHFCVQPCARLHCIDGTGTLQDVAQYTTYISLFCLSVQSTVRRQTDRQANIRKYPDIETWKHSSLPTDLWLYSHDITSWGRLAGRHEPNITAAVVSIWMDLEMEGYFVLHFFLFFLGGSWLLVPPGGSWWLLVAPGGSWWLLVACGFCGFLWLLWLLWLLAPMAHLSSIDQSISEACSPGACCALDTP